MDNPKSMLGASGTRDALNAVRRDRAPACVHRDRAGFPGPSGFFAISSTPVVCRSRHDVARRERLRRWPGRPKARPRRASRRRGSGCAASTLAPTPRATPLASARAPPRAQTPPTPPACRRSTRSPGPGATPSPPPPTAAPSAAAARSAPPAPSRCPCRSARSYWWPRRRRASTRARRSRWGASLPSGSQRTRAPARHAWCAGELRSARALRQRKESSTARPPRGGRKGGRGRRACGGRSALGYGLWGFRRSEAGLPCVGAAGPTAGPERAHHGARRALACAAPAGVCNPGRGAERRRVRAAAGRDQRPVGAGGRRRGGRGSREVECETAGCQQQVAVQSFLLRRAARPRAPPPAPRRCSPDARRPRPRRTFFSARACPSASSATATAPGACAAAWTRS